MSIVIVFLAAFAGYIIGVFRENRRLCRIAEEHERQHAHELRIARGRPTSGDIAEQAMHQALGGR